MCQCNSKCHIFACLSFFASQVLVTGVAEFILPPLHSSGSRGSGARSGLGSGLVASGSWSGNSDVREEVLDNFFDDPWDHSSYYNNGLMVVVDQRLFHPSAPHTHYSATPSALSYK